MEDEKTREPITQILYHKFTVAQCNPLYPNVVKLEDVGYQQYGETLKKFNREIYQWLMKINSNVSDENLHRSIFSTSDKKQSQIAWKICHNSKRIISRDNFQDLDGKYCHETFILFDDKF